MVSYCARWLHHWVWLLGEEEEASHYLYEITAFKGNTKWVEHFVDLILIFCILMNCFPFRYIYISEVASLRTSDDEIVSEGEYLSKSCILVSASECFVLGRKKSVGMRKKIWRQKRRVNLAVSHFILLLFGLFRNSHFVAVVDVVAINKTRRSLSWVTKMT